MARRRRSAAADEAAAPDTALAIDPGRVRDILVSFLKVETTRAGRDRLVVGLSGGLDSAVAAVLAAEALGRDGVLGVLLPYRSSSTDSAADARRVIEQLGIPSETVPISPMVDAYFASRQDASRHRQGNKMARERMSILYDLSEEHGGLVLGTSNKTELLLGYGTLHGDLAHALNPLGDLYKTQVRQLAAFLDVPAPILAKAPSADLWPGQSDEEDLGMTYADADPILHHLFDRRASDEALRAMGFDRDLVRRIRDRVRRSQFKRRMPLIAKVSLRTVGIDFRYPRDWGT